MMTKRYSVTGAAAMAALMLSSLPTQAWAVEVRDFFGTSAFAYDQQTYSAPLWASSLSMNRRDFLWSKYEPTQGNFDDTYLQSYIAGQVAPGQAAGVQFMPILNWNPGWSIDQTARTYYNTVDNQANGAYGQATQKYDMVPLGSGQFQYTVSTWTRYFNWPTFSYKYRWEQTSQSTMAAVNAVGDSAFPIAANQLANRAEFVTNVVNAMKPYGVQYYQVGNEACPTSGFWWGDFDTYMKRIHLPDAATIHAAGGKVVYGGWPSSESVDTYINLLNYNNAWSSIDVLDVHYHALRDMDTLYNAAVAAGRSDIGIWQSEYGFTGIQGMIGNVNPRFLNWALNHNGAADPNRYKISWFAVESVPEFGEGLCLYNTDRTTLSNHGKSLDTLSRTLGGKNLRILDGVTNSRNWTPSLDESSDSIESFISDGGRVVAMHTSATSGTVTLTIPGFSGYKLSDIDVFRIDQAGYSEDLSSKFSISGDNLIIDVNILDNALSPVKSWSLGTSENTFYVQVVVPEPSTALLVLSGGGCLALGTRRRRASSASGRR